MSVTLDLAGTSAAGSMLSAQRPATVLLLAVGLCLGTSASPASAPSWSTAILIPASSYSSPNEAQRRLSTHGVSQRRGQAQGKLVAELRRISGLTWEQMARLFDVSRRTVHFWASGKPMLPVHEERLVRVVAAVRKVDRGSAAATRRAIVSITPDNEVPFDLLSAGRYAEFEAGLGVRPPRAMRVLKPLSAREREARRPIHPSIAVDAHHDKVHKDITDETKSS